MGANGHQPCGGPQTDELTHELQATLLDLADLTLVGTQLGWSVVGPLSRPLRLQLGELVDAWRNLADAVADRILALRAWPDVQATALTGSEGFEPLASGPFEDFVAVQELTRRLDAVSRRARTRLERGGALDLASQGVMIEIVGTLEQQLWTVRAQLPAAAKT